MRNDAAQLRWEIQRLKEENVKLKEEDLKLKQANLTLTEDNLRLSRNNVQLSQNNLTLREKATPMRRRISGLEKEMEELKDKMRIQDPLVKVGVAIRLRFWEQAREIRGLGTANTGIVEAGNSAAHRGDICADAALFCLGHMAPSLLGRSSGAGTAPTEEDMKVFFHMLYTIPFQHVAVVPSAYSPKEREFLNLSATMASCSSSVTAGSRSLVDNNCGDLDRFHWLACDCVRMYNVFREANVENPKDAFEASPEVEGRLQELRDIADRTVRLNLGKNRCRRG